MLLGNATSGVSLGLTNIIDALTTQQQQVETMLALGATRWEATKAHVHKAIITAMTPILNQMSVVGVVSIPGMMTGQILGGQAPLQAARYQVRGSSHFCGHRTRKHPQPQTLDTVHSYVHSSRCV
jgi:putative ABC transport system permease protein